MALIKYKVWVDDERTPPTREWVWVQGYDSAIWAFLYFDMSEVSLDHDLGEEDPMKNGYQLLCYFEKRLLGDGLPIPYIRIHTMNGAVRQKMQKLADKLNQLRQS